MDTASGRRGRRRSRPPSPPPGNGGVALAVLLSAAFVITIGFGAPPEAGRPTGAQSLPAGARPLAATAGCPDTAVDPGDVVVGLRNVEVRFAVRSSGCDVTGWSLTWPAAVVEASDDVPVATVRPARLRDADAGRSRLTGTLGLADASSGAATVRAVLRHRATWGSGLYVVAGRPGRPGRLHGTLGRAWWEGGRYVAMPGRRVRLLFRTAGSSAFAVVASARTGEGGRLSLRLPDEPADRAGVWQVQYPGDATTGPATALVATR